MGFILQKSSFNPEPLYRFIAKTLIKTIYKTKFIGFDKIPKTGPVILICNHLSYVDGIIIQAGCNRPVRFMIDQYIYNAPIVNHIMRHNKGIPILPKKESVAAALDTISKALEEGDAVCIFPEGQLTYTGNLGRFKPGIEWIIERDPVPVYPLAIKGLWNSMFSRKYRKSAFRWFPKGVRSRVTAICGDAIHPGNIRVNHLQRVILGLKDTLEQRQL